MIEVWKEIEVAGALYEISNQGNMRRFGSKKNKVLYKTKGYPVVCLCNKRIQVSRTIHRLVALAFIPNPDNKPQVNHINGIKDDNRVENLEWVTASENQIHKIYQLKNYPGRKYSFTKEETNLICDKSVPLKNISHLFKCSHSTLRRVRVGLYKNIISRSSKKAS